MGKVMTVAVVGVDRWPGSAGSPYCTYTCVTVLLLISPNMSSYASYNAPLTGGSSLLYNVYMYVTMLSDYPTSFLDLFDCIPCLLSPDP